MLAFVTWTLKVTSKPNPQGTLRQPSRHKLNVLRIMNQLLLLVVGLITLGGVQTQCLWDVMWAVDDSCAFAQIGDLRLSGVTSNTGFANHLAFNCMFPCFTFSLTFGFPAMLRLFHVLPSACCVLVGG